MMRRVYLIVLGVGIALVPLLSEAEIVVLTQEPVAEFTLPDGSVLKNAFVWKRSSQGLMIIHDEGEYYLNFTTLPDDWREAYGLAESVEEKERPAEKREIDHYNIRSVLKTVPALDDEALEKLLERGLSTELDQGVLVLGLVQGLLDNDQNSAYRCMLFLEEKGYEIEDVARDRLFESCTQCRGDGVITKKCRDCDSSGDCSKCSDSDPKLGKMNDIRDDKKSDRKFGKTTNCDVCEDSGKCAACGGKGELGIACTKCRSNGKTVAREYCEIIRDKWVREMNALVSGNPPAPVITSPSADMEKMLSQLPGIDPHASDYYFSPAYDGGMDTNIVMACLMHSLVNGEFSAAKRFNLMLELEYPESDVMEIEDYLRFCEKCESEGRINRECSSCEGSGECAQCGGSGDRMGLKNWKVDCSACKGSGDCGNCGGSGQIRSACKDCKGMGRVIERRRCAIRYEVLVDEVNEYFRQHRPDSL